MAVRAQRKEKSNLVTWLEEVLPLLWEHIGVTKIGIFGSTARKDRSICGRFWRERVSSAGR